ncbi:PIN domain-like protein [Schizophyllum commune]
MHRVRMLRHNGAEPYIDFDGGPLPAKKGTENERRHKREESLARANMLAARGKYSQVRDHYLKCVDVTPEMAYQAIKALRVENVKCVAFLERTGAVHAILTKDSDLLLLGCKNILFKVDHAYCTVVAISRADFASVTACDGVSLLAEQCFLHQPIYYPSREELVHLTDVGDDWRRTHAYSPDIAKGIAHGELDPETHLPVKDVYPKFVPLPLMTLDLKIGIEGDAVAPPKSATPNSGGILDFFGMLLERDYIAVSPRETTKATVGEEDENKGTTSRRGRGLVSYGLFPPVLPQVDPDEIGDAAPKPVESFSSTRDGGQF